MKIDQHTNVLDVSNNIDKDTYKIYTDQGTIDAEYIFVATGNFSYPYKPFNHGRHYSEIEKFSDIYGDLAVVIGGNESGFDAQSIWHYPVKLSIFILILQVINKKMLDQVFDFLLIHTNDMKN